MLDLDLDYPARAATLARRLDAIAGSLEERARQLTASGAASGWAGPASRAFHREAHGSLARLRHAAAEVHAAADAIRRHGLAAQHLLDHRLGGRAP